MSKSELQLRQSAKAAYQDHVRDKGTEMYNRLRMRKLTIA